MIEVTGQVCKQINLLLKPRLMINTQNREDHASDDNEVLHVNHTTK